MKQLWLGQPSELFCHPISCSHPSPKAVCIPALGRRHAQAGSFVLSLCTLKFFLRLYHFFALIVIIIYIKWVLFKISCGFCLLIGYWLIQGISNKGWGWGGGRKIECSYNELCWLQFDRVRMEIISGKMIKETREILLEYLFHCLIKKLLNKHLLPGWITKLMRYIMTQPPHSLC